MKKTLSILLLLFISALLVLGLATWLRNQTDRRLPAPLQPALAWINGVQDEAARRWDDWSGLSAGRSDDLATLAGQGMPPSNDGSPESLIEQVTLGRNDIASVKINNDGSTEITGAAVLSESNRVIDASGAGDTDVDAQSLVRRTDAAIARADAELARVLAGGRPAPKSAGTLAADGAGLSGSRTPGASDAAVASGSVLAGATAALAAAGAVGPGAAGTLSASLLPVSGNDSVAAGIVVSPDAPDPTQPVSAGGLEQQDTIRHFLSGETVEFELGRTALTERGERALLALLDIIRRHQGTVITIQGHTDSVGDGVSNLALSTARASVARSFLIRRGVNPDRLRVQGFGERRPIAANNSQSGRIQNRRIDFAVSDR